jgi:hypothetical protein
MAKMVALTRIKDSPWRDKVRNPINPNMVDILAESIGTTQEFWEGVYGREVGDMVELAFGHHRIDAARAQGLKEVPITLRKFTDGEMLVWMVRENTKGELLVVLEAINAAVKAYGAGTVEMEALDPKTNKSVIRYAPGFIEGKAASGTPGVPHPYTADTLARFLGRKYFRTTSKKASNSVRAALGILEAEEMVIPNFSTTMFLKNTEQDGDEEKTYKPAKEIIQIIADLRQRAKKIAERQVEVKKANDADAIAKLAVQKAFEARATTEEAKKKVALDKMKAAREAEDKAESDRIFLKMKAQKEAQIAKNLADTGKLEAIEARVAERNRKEEEARNEDAYFFVRREVERILGKLHGTTSTSKEALAEEVKALARKTLKPNDRERLRQAALLMGTWYNEFVATQFLPPLTKRRTK